LSYGACVAQITVTSFRDITCIVKSLKGERFCGGATIEVGPLTWSFRRVEEERSVVDIVCNDPI